MRKFVRWAPEALAGLRRGDIYALEEVAQEIEKAVARKLLGLESSDSLSRPVIGSNPNRYWVNVFGKEYVAVFEVDRKINKARVVAVGTGEWTGKKEINEKDVREIVAVQGWW